VERKQQATSYWLIDLLQISLTFKMYIFILFYLSLKIKIVSNGEHCEFPTLSCHRGWAMGRGRGQPRVDANFATFLRYTVAG